ncbi:uncharacterized protein MYCFIDRAFT_171029 [Pseudocercospora fijiensis CIRAD86]|uniref:Uncharacterized protein n=1 Tax=Pseudocercospora fijiensis (strain CIRAD86) TaxID=383855 RepID=N1QBQ3_PSEFD|nr:uncharacterized protein MYCFIDRAFT_171029 [Pseudocercospora fijiensis CIRAD86]EME89601.1 hypothetical protein MYCFIDRAFT_171029 [Pseudocercospora fijiensis CIRAD86]
MRLLLYNMQATIKPCASRVAGPGIYPSISQTETPSTPIPIAFYAPTTRKQAPQALLWLDSYHGLMNADAGEDPPSHRSLVLIVAFYSAKVHKKSLVSIAIIKAQEVWYNFGSIGGCNKVRPSRAAMSAHQ